MRVWGDSYDLLCFKSQIPVKRNLKTFVKKEKKIRGYNENPLSYGKIKK